MKSQKGFTLVEGMLVVIAITLIGFAGWYVWNESNSRDDNELTSATKPSGKSANKTDLPEGYAEFKDTKVGIRFGYPQTWGTAKIGPSRESNHLSKGSEYEITFSNNPDITAGLVSNDRTHDDLLGHGGSVYAGAYTDIDFAAFKQQSQPNTTTTTHTITSDMALYSTELGAFGCEGAGTILTQTIPGNSTYRPIAFLSFDKKTDPDNPDESICENYDSHVSQETIEHFRKISKTIRGN